MFQSRLGWPFNFILFATTPLLKLKWKISEKGKKKSSYVLRFLDCFELILRLSYFRRQKLHIKDK